MAICFFNEKSVVSFKFLPTRFGFFKTVEEGLTKTKKNKHLK